MKHNVGNVRRVRRTPTDGLRAVQVHLEPHLLRTIKQEAVRREVCMSELARELILDGLSRLPPPPKDAA